MPSYRDRKFVNNLKGGTVYYTKDFSKYRKGKLIGYFVDSCGGVASYLVETRFRRHMVPSILTEADYRSRSCFE